MFYSHAILTNNEYGVATVWLVATVGRNGSKRVTRKAIQEVNVPKACEVIMDPGAPLGLRLQSDLLYGITKVFAAQCTYVLNDAEKTQSDMKLLLRTIQTSGIDLRVGNTKRPRITLPDDPHFDPMNALQGLELLHIGNDHMFSGNKRSSLNASKSQLTPLTYANQGNSSGWKLLRPFQLDLSRSSLPTLNYTNPLNVDRNNSSLMKHTLMPIDMGEFQPFGQQEEDDSFLGADLNFDEHGNLLDIDEDGNILDIDEHEDLELPNLPRLRVDQPRHGQEHIMEADGEEVLHRTGGDGVFMNEAPLPDAYAFNPNTKPMTADTSQPLDLVSAGTKKTRKYKTIKPDEQTFLGIRIVYDWQNDYVENMNQAREASEASKSKKYAENLIFNYGLAEVGVPLPDSVGVHPLAEQFSGTTFMANILGLDPAEAQEDENEKQSRRRKSHQAFENEPEDRRTRARYHGVDREYGRGLGDTGGQFENEPEEHRTGARYHGVDREYGRGLGDTGGQLVFDDDYLPEMGMNAAQGMIDNHSSTMPWGGPGSVVPSSVRDPGSNQKPRIAPSPVADRHSHHQHDLNDWATFVARIQSSVPSNTSDLEGSSSDT